MTSRLYGNDRLSEDKALGSGESRMESGAMSEVQLGLAEFVNNSEFCY
jgi:hypothetical protein